MQLVDEHKIPQKVNSTCQSLSFSKKCIVVRYQHVDWDPEWFALNNILGNPPPRDIARIPVSVEPIKEVLHGFWHPLGCVDTPAHTLELYFNPNF